VGKIAENSQTKFPADEGKSVAVEKQKGSAAVKIPEVIVDLR